MLNPAGPKFEHRTDNVIARGAAAGKVDRKEAGILRHQNVGIREQVREDLANGINPRTDETLAEMQKNHRQTALSFTHNNHDAGDRLSLSPEARQEMGKPQVSYTDPEGNNVTKTRDGYTYSENADGTTTTTTPGGYSIDYDKENASLTMTDGKTGESTSIWGDPHVSESDESGNFWDFDSATNSFVLPDGTKITCNATSADGTLTDVDIYSGTGRTHISNSIENGNSLTHDRFIADSQSEDGTTYYSNLRANDWYTGSYMGEEMQSSREGWEGLPYYV